MCPVCLFLFFPGKISERRPHVHAMQTRDEQGPGLMPVTYDNVGTKHRGRRQKNMCES